MNDQLLEDAKRRMDQTLEHLEQTFMRLNVGRASTALVEDLPVSAYGSVTPLKGCASITVPDASSLAIAPWDRGLIAEIEKAIQASSLGLTPQNDGVVIRLNIPKPTEEKRRELAKNVREAAEQTRIAIRTVRQEVHAKHKEQQKAGEITEDDLRMLEKQLQHEVDRVNGRIEELSSEKENDLLKI